MEPLDRKILGIRLQLAPSWQTLMVMPHRGGLGRKQRPIARDANRDLERLSFACLAWGNFRKEAIVVHALKAEGLQFLGFARARHFASCF